MISLVTAGNRFESTLRTEIGLPFRGAIMPIEDAKHYPDDYNHVRQILRVGPRYKMTPGTVIQDPAGRYFILGELDSGLENDGLLYTSFVLYPVSKRVEWRRPAQAGIDPITGLKRATTETAKLADIRVLIETLTREERVSNVGEETKRVVTGAQVELGDVIDGMRVRKVNVTHGIRVLEVV